MDDPVLLKKYDLDIWAHQPRDLEIGYSKYFAIKEELNIILSNICMNRTSQIKFEAI